MKKLFSFKWKQKTTKTQTTEEIIQEITQKQQAEEQEMTIYYDRELQQLRRSYEERVDEERLFEKEMSFTQLVQEAQSGEHPFEYTIERGSVNYQRTIFLRSKQSPNPFRIVVETHKNCVFLAVRVGDNGNVENNLITLYYDKLKKTYMEYRWTVACDFATKHHLRMFLYDMIKHVEKDLLTGQIFYKNEFRARDEFWKKEHIWTKEYEEMAAALEAERKEKLAALKALHEEEMTPYVTELRKKEEQEWLLTLQRIQEKNEYEKEEAKRRDWMLRANQQIVYDAEVDKRMKALYAYARDLTKKQHLLIIEQAYELERLYEKDLQELWRAFAQLDEEKQTEEKVRFLALLVTLEARLNDFEEKMDEMETLDYEKKMAYMEKKYSQSLLT